MPSFIEIKQFHKEIILKIVSFPFVQTKVDARTANNSRIIDALLVTCPCLGTAAAAIAIHRKLKACVLMWMASESPVILFPLDLNELVSVKFPPPSRI